MNLRLKLLALISAVSVFALSQAKADTLVYDNGPVNGTIDGWTISSGYSVSNSFVVASDSTLTSASVGLLAGGNPLSLSWSIGTTVFGSEVSSGVSSLSNSNLGISLFGFLVYESTFSLSGAVGIGTYYLTLSDASASGGGEVFWDQNDGPSTTQIAFAGDPLTPPDGSQSFKLYGVSGVSVPDSAATLALLGGALLSVAALRRRLAA